jgi:glycosyltransferase involved in cell wall biosynthesis
MAIEFRVSVCLAAHNGARFIREQVESILSQLSLGDELIVVDDASSDDTVAILEGFRDARIRIIRQVPNCGVLKTFERALREAAGEVIFLCDQDDVWRGDKVAKTLEAFERTPGATLVLSNGDLIDSRGRSLEEALHASDRLPLGVAANLVRNRYQGSTMAFRREILAAALPFPGGIPMHDSWIGIVNAVVGRAVYLPQKLVSYRRHGDNVTSRHHGTVYRMLAQRWGLLKALIGRTGALLRVRRVVRAQLSVP